MKSDKVFQWTLQSASILILMLFAGFFITLIYSSIPSIQHFKFKFYTGTNWDPTTLEYGSLPFFAGTLITSFLALLLSFPFSIMIALYLGEYFKEGMLSNILKSLVELLAGIPSVIYGLWGLFVFVPIIRNIQMKLVMSGILNIPPYGIGMFTASAILAVMIIPYSASIAREVISMVPNDLKEAAYSMGATRFEVIKKIILPYCRSGIWAGVLLSLGRALGETMAVTMVIGNRNVMPKTIFDPANTLASLMANEFAEAVNRIHLSSLIHLGLVLFITTAVVNILGKVIIQKTSVR